MAVLITGASKGIGRALAYEFAKHGYDLVITARHEDLLTELAAEISSLYPIQINTIALDLSYPKATEKLITDIAEKGLFIDCLVNNAGIGSLGDFASLDSKTLNELLQINIVALTELTRHYAQQFLILNKGKILQVASIAGFQPGPKMAAYYASKAYVISLSQALGYELKHSGVSLSILCPGPTETNFWDRQNLNKTRLAKGYIGLMSAKKVAEIAYKGLQKNKRFIIPGFLNKFFTFANTFMPSSVSMWVVRFFHRKKV